MAEVGESFSTNAESCTDVDILQVKQSNKLMNTPDEFLLKYCYNNQQGTFYKKTALFNGNYFVLLTGLYQYNL